MVKGQTLRLKSVFLFITEYHETSHTTCSRPLAAFELPPALASGKAPDNRSSADFLKRNRLIGYMLAKQLPTVHLSALDLRWVAQAAFTLDPNQSDFQKRFLLQKDVDQLRAFAPYIDDNLVQGNNPLPDAGMDILGERIDQAEKMVEAILAAGVDFNASETLETDPKNSNLPETCRGFRTGGARYSNLKLSPGIWNSRMMRKRPRTAKVRMHCCRMRGQRSPNGTRKFSAACGRRLVRITTIGFSMRRPGLRSAYELYSAGWQGTVRHQYAGQS